MALAYLLDPCIEHQNRAGTNNVNGYFEVFFSGTDDRATVYRDFDKTLAPAQIRIDNNGRCVMVVDSSKAYRVEMREPNGDLVYSQYPVWAVARGDSHGYTAGFGITISELDDIAVDTDVIQKKLNAGDNIQIDSETGTISATDTTYSAGANVSISDENVISATDTTYSAGANVSISDQNVISAVDTKYTAGTNVSISDQNVISAVDTKYTAGTNVSISDQNVISATDTKYTAGANVSISDQNVISAENTTYSAGANVQINNNVISATDTKYTAGTNVSISDQNVISAVDTKYTAGAGLNLNGTEFSVDTDTVQSKLTAGSNITINGSTISATDTTYSAGPNIDIYNGVISTEKPRVEAGTNVSVSSVLDNVTRTITYTVSATDTQYTAGNGLSLNNGEFSVDTSVVQPKLTAGSNVQINNNVISATDTTYTAGSGISISGGQISCTVSPGPTYTAGTNVQINNGVISATDTNTHRPVNVNGSQVLGDNTTALNLVAGSNVTLSASGGDVTINASTGVTSGIFETVTPSNSFAEVKAVLDAHNEPLLSVADNNGAALFRRVFYGVIAPPPQVVMAVRFARVAGSIYEMYSIDSASGTWTYTAVPLTKHRNNAELYFYNSQDGDHYHVRNIANYAVNHVAVQGHSGDICSIVIEAPTLGLNEEYDYVVVFDCSNSSGGCNVSVQGCDCEIDTKWEVDVTAVPLKTFAIDVTNTYVEFTGSPQYQIEVLGNRWHRHKF